MPALDIDSQFKFLVSCIKHSTAGKVDFVAVANELNIVSKAAAAKRYERLLKAHGAPASGRANAQPQGGLATPNSSSKRPSKKRKAPATANSDDDEDVKPNVAEAKAKTEDAEDDGVQVKTETKPDVKVKQEQPIALSDDDDYAI